MAEPPKLSTRKVVIDAGAAIKMQRLERFGGELYTTGGVLREVKDEKARALLKTLPEEIRVREAIPKDLAYSREFAKATGDLGFLSHNDLELIALTVGIHREEGGTLRDRPAMLQALEGTASFDWAPAKPSAAKEEAAKSEDAVAAPVADVPAEDDGWTQAPQRKRRGGGPRPAAPAPLAPAPAEPVEPPAPEAAPEVREEKADDKAGAEPPAPDAVPEAREERAVEEAGGDEADAAEDEEDESDVDSSDAGEWVTTENMYRFGLGVADDDEEMKVTCATSDYSVQNVLLQMGITPLTFDGYAVKSVKLWGLICRACCHFHRDTQRVFCPKCGNDTVVRVPIIVGEDGAPKVLDNGRKLRTKGTIFSVPKPQGGRAFKPIFAEDEIKIGARDRDLRHAQKVYEKERECRDPFNEDNGARQWHQRNTTGSGRQINCNAPKMAVGFGRGNPNAGNYRGFKSRNKK